MPKHFLAGRFRAAFGLFLGSLLWLALSGVSARADFLIAQAGQPRCVIVCQAGASAPELYAAADLAANLKQITGAQFTVRVVQKGQSLPARQSVILIGSGPLTTKLFPDISHLGSEELIMRSKGRFLALAGGRPRGTVYAVSRFLQEQCGVCWWTPSAARIPHRPTLRLTALNVRETPAFEYREPYWFSALDGAWAVHNGDNGQFARVTSEMGGKTIYTGFVHTFYSLVPPEKYFKIHPEWYSLINGKRTYQGAQLCLTNPQLKDFVVARVKELLRQSPNTDIISISQNDQFGACECPVCKALDDREGGHAGTLLSFVNYVAEKIAPEFPHVAVDTLAYQYTRRPPRTIKPRPNVIVRLCSIECNFAAPLSDPSNAAFAADLRDWSKICNRLYIWDYVTDFSAYVQPFPNWFVLGPNLRFFQAHHVRGVFEEGAYQSNGSEMAEMRAWVLAQLLWNPHQDDSALINEFLTGYYGAPSAHFIRRYLDLMHQAAHGYYLTINSPPDAPFLNFHMLTQAEGLWRQAEKAAQNDPARLWRVRQAHLPVRYVWLVRWSALRREALRTGAVWPLPESRKAVADEWLATATGPGPPGWSPLTHLNEGGLTPQAFVAAFAQDPPPPPKRFLASPPTDLPGGEAQTGIDVQDDRVTLYREGDLAEIRPDASASDGAAVWMTGTTHEWAFNVPISRLPARAQHGSWKVYAVIRIQKKPGAPETGNAFTAGVWDTQARVSRADASDTVAGASAQYHSYLLGTVTFKPGQYIWVAPTANPAVEAVWVDRIYLVPQS
jgi:hypothetical protein